MLASSPLYRTVLKQFRLPLMLTASLRTLPNFLIIGAQKGGTTSLYEYLVQHPQIAPALSKEVHYFDQHFSKGQDWYRSNFPIRSSAGTKYITGEATPYYLFHPFVPERVHALLPDVKIIIMLRDPVDRAFSHYRHSSKRGRETVTSFEEAIKLETARLSSKDFSNASYRYSHQHHSYLARGIYVEQLETWLNYFPKEHFHIIESETFFQNTAQIFNSVLGFLELDAWQPESFFRFNQNKASTINTQTRVQLERFFHPYSQRLEELLDMKFSWS